MVIQAYLHFWFCHNGFWFFHQIQQVHKAFGLNITGGSFVVEGSKNRPPRVRFGAAKYAKYG
jgi:hypothetical protein